MSTKKKPNRSKTPKLKKGAWFVPVRWSYLPASPQAWALYMPYTLFLILVLLVAVSADTVAEGITIAVPSFVAAAAVMQWIASHKS